MTNFTHLPAALPVSINFDFRVGAEKKVAPWCLRCNNWVAYGVHESGEFEHQTIDGHVRDHCGIDVYTVKCHDVTEKFALHIFSNPVRWDRLA